MDGGCYSLRRARAAADRKAADRQEGRTGALVENFLGGAIRAWSCSVNGSAAAADR